MAYRLSMFALLLGPFGFAERCTADRMTPEAWAAYAASGELGHYANSSWESFLQEMELRHLNRAHEPYDPETDPECEKEVVPCRCWRNGASTCCKRGTPQLMKQKKYCDCAKGEAARVACAKYRLAEAAATQKDTTKGTGKKPKKVLTKTVESDKTEREDWAEATAECPEGMWVQSCESSYGTNMNLKSAKKNIQDGLYIGPNGNNCTVRSAGGLISAIATCSNKAETVAVPSDNKSYIDSRWVSASCNKDAGEKAIACTCETRWGGSYICKKESWFAPDETGTCKKKIPPSAGRRRMIADKKAGEEWPIGAGAKIWALCQKATSEADEEVPAKKYAKNECEAYTTNELPETSCCRMKEPKLGKVKKGCKKLGTEQLAGKMLPEEWGHKCCCPGFTCDK